MPKSLSSTKAPLVLFAGALVLATCLSGFWVWYQLSKSIGERSLTRNLLIEWQQTYSMLKDVETGARGFLIAEDESYLAPFDQATNDIPKHLQQISLLEEDVENGYTSAQLAHFQKLTDEFLSKTREIMSVVRRENQQNAIDLLKDDTAKSAMDAIRAFCEKRTVELDAQLRELDTAMKKDLTNGGRSIAALVLAAIIAGLAAAAVLRESFLQARRAERLAEEKLKVERANREKSTFLATMSHEIRTPMNAILGFGELLASDARDDKQKRYADSIVRSGQALLQLINDILDLSKIEAGMIEINTAPVNVREIADFTRQLFSHQLSEKGVEFRVEVEEEVPASLLVDGVRLRQIVLNLVGNAIKFTQTGHVMMKFGGVRTSGQRSTYHLTLLVEDSGVGIPASRIDDIFEPFVQAKASRDAELKGTGLGLAIVKRLVSLMGGSIRVESQEGRGTSFFVDLPRVEISARLAQSSAALPEQVDFNQLRPSSILVVDDNPVNLSLVRGYFDSTHHTIYTASNGQEALDWLVTNRPDVVLMDIRMPVMDGRTALNQMRNRKGLELLPVIAVTASSMAREEGDLRKAFDGYVRKPFSRTQLFEELSHFIPRHADKSTQPVQDEEVGPAPEAWRDLTAALRLLEKEQWPSVTNGMVMSEVVQFAAQLKNLAESAACPPLLSLAVRIQSQAEGFALEEMEKSLASFPDVISQLEQRLPPP